MRYKLQHAVLSAICELQYEYDVKEHKLRLLMTLLRARSELLDKPLAIYSEFVNFPNSKDRQLVEWIRMMITEVSAYPITVCLHWVTTACTYMALHTVGQRPQCRHVPVLDATCLLSVLLPGCKTATPFL